MRKFHRSQKGATLVELTIIIAVIGILAAVAVPKYMEMINDQMEYECKKALSELREVIEIHMEEKSTWPSSAEELVNYAAFKVHEPFVNPYQGKDNAPDSIVITCMEKDTVTHARGGWAYNPTTGEIWPNTDMVGENKW